MTNSSSSNNNSATSPPSFFGESKVNFVMLEEEANDVELFNRDSIFYDRNTWSQMIATKRLEYRLQLERYSRFVFGLGIALLVFGLLCLGGVWWKGRGTQHEDQTQFQIRARTWMNETLAKHAGGYKNADEQCNLVAPVARVDCNPDPPINKDVCLARGCCWSPGVDNVTAAADDKVLPPVGVPYCYFGANYQGYKVVRIEDFGHTQVLHLKRQQPSGFRDDVPLVKLTAEMLSKDMIRVRLVDAVKARYEVPIPRLNLPPRFLGDDKRRPNITAFFDKTTSTFSIHRADSNATEKERVVLFATNLATLIYSEQFLQLSNKLPSSYIYGIGEHMSTLQKTSNWARYTQLARDQYPKSGEALYGAHNFYLSQSGAGGGATGVFLFNSNAMDIITQPEPRITWRTIGGVLDYFIFLGPRPEDVVTQYVNLIGRPVMPPYWALGFHLSRFGYQTLDNLTAVHERNKAAGIPLDVQWTDIDMFDANNDFTYDRARFAGLPAFIERLHGEGRRFVPMFDCGISAGEKKPYLPYTEGLAMNVFVRNASGGVLVGKVWNTKSTVWPDFFHPNATAWWTRQFARYHKTIGFDGAWIDMNEPSNFFDGSDVGCPLDSALEQPQYTPGKDQPDKALRRHSLCATAQQAIGSHYNLHNLYGFSEAIVTNSALRSVLPNRRPFIISRSTAPGHGAFASHWTGDVVSDWDSMRASVASVLNFNLFGIPMVGADICGFNGNTSEELCARWHQLGAFYTFSRNHNTDDAREQDPVAFGSRVVNAAKSALLVRYRHLPYLYTLFWRASSVGGTVLRPLFFEFPADRVAAGLELQFLWGSSLMIAPVVQGGAAFVNVYFPPNSWWYRVSDFGAIKGTGNFFREPASFDHPNAYYRAGAVVPVHQHTEVTTDRLRKGNFELIVATDPIVGNASGELYWDEGDGLNTHELGLYNHYRFEVGDSNTKLSIISTHLGFNTTQTFAQITVLGVFRKPHQVLIDGQSVDSSYNSSNQTLIISAGNHLPLYPPGGHEVIKHVIEWKV